MVKQTVQIWCLICLLGIWEAVSPNKDIVTKIGICTGWFVVSAAGLYLTLQSLSKKPRS